MNEKVLRKRKGTKFNHTILITNNKLHIKCILLLNVIVFRVLYRSITHHAGVPIVSNLIASKGLPFILPFTAFDRRFKQKKRIPKTLFHRLTSISKKQRTSLHKESTERLLNYNLRIFPG